jgi:hypothetical protein
VIFTFQDFISIVQVVELPLTIFGGYFVFKKIKDSKDVKEWMATFRDARDVLKDSLPVLTEILEEYKRSNGHGKKD